MDSPMFSTADTAVHEKPSLSRMSKLCLLMVSLLRRSLLTTRPRASGFPVHWTFESGRVYFCGTSKCPYAALYAASAATFMGKEIDRRGPSQSNPIASRSIRFDVGSDNLVLRILCTRTPSGRPHANAGHSVLRGTLNFWATCMSPCTTLYATNACTTTLQGTRVAGAAASRARVPSED
ncbi:hypothetical protein H310_13797 [Aphanomyces invadans]|uniref:Uncharacterized protein n=1 Tax=Aphanomyces invadans TaxID=157072 RepID=A0A024TDR2_9STRA|nr:hypothetical protein H310_13797 [Aphanomyces invadans]ETV91731.1 hypothetical protein H310_13797 [Aphanomyces invadans]|eukprot:XP_008879657.1 hypothetical protein H310_13797 [Aphanomyces invadans]